MICMAGLQVFIVRFFFQGARKGKSFFGLEAERALTVACRLCMNRGFARRYRAIYGSITTDPSRDILHLCIMLFARSLRNFLVYT